MKNFYKKVSNPLFYNLFLFWKLPAAFWSGVRLKSINSKQAIVSVPYFWLSQNPFRSTYFACLSMAAEMSTGLLALGNVMESGKNISMLVVDMESQFLKKATQKTYFTCSEGDKIAQTIEEAIATGEGKICTITSIGKDKSGKEIAKFQFTWSFKVKKQTKN